LSESERRVNEGLQEMMSMKVELRERRSKINELEVSVFAGGGNQLTIGKGDKINELEVSVWAGGGGNQLTRGKGDKINELEVSL